MGRLVTFWNFIRRYKYLTAIFIFLFLVGFVDENSLYTRYQRRVVIGNLHREIDKYQRQFDTEREQLQALENDPASVERMARERYFMKRPNEDVFVFVSDSEDAE